MRICNHIANIDLKVSKRKRKPRKKKKKSDDNQFLSVPPPERRRFSPKQYVSAKHKSAETGRRLHLRWLPVLLCSICSMKCDLKKKLLLFSFMLYLTLNVESRHEVNGTSEENIMVKFTLNSDSNSKPSLYKNGEKKGVCKQISPCNEKFALSDVENSIVTLHITNLTLEDEGMYHVAVLPDKNNPFIESNKIYIRVKVGNKTTETEKETEAVHESIVTNSPKLDSSDQKPFFIFFSASVIVFICLFVGILYWLFRTYPRKPDGENPPVHNNRTAQQQGQCGTSGAVFVSCVEYGELDFQNRPERDDRVKPAEATSKTQDGVEYAAIIFPQQKQTPCGRIRNKQQVPAIK